MPSRKLEDLEGLLGCLLTAEDAAEGGEVQQVTLGGADDEADVSHQQHDEELQEGLSARVSDSVADDNAKEGGTNDAKDAANGGADQAFEADLAETDFEQDNGETQNKADKSIQRPAQSEGLQVSGNGSDNEDK
jgi:hypothetical protein